MKAREHLIFRWVLAAIGSLFFLHVGAAASEPDSTALPTETLGEKQWAIVNVSVCNLRQANDYDAGMASQALLGMPVKLLQKDGWYEIETPDNYRSWVLGASLQLVTRAELEQWNRAEQVVVTAIYGFVYSKATARAQTVSDVVAGNRLKLLGSTRKFYHVAYPDGRTGYLPKADGQPVEKWRRAVRHDAAGIIETGKRLMGVPYMWGGTSTKGVDCSGFVRTTLLQHDIIIPRDASQQAFKGQHIDIAPDFGNLLPGDLVFFGRKATDGKPAHVSHVGIYIGNKKFIHSLGWVHISSFNPADAEYDEYNLGRLLWAQRILPYINHEEGMNTTDHNSFYR
jgi:cell wall-associated NlpC family hydrolase